MYKNFYLFLLITITIELITASTDDIYKKCSDSIECIEKEMINYVDRIDNATETVQILGDFLVLEKNQPAAIPGRSHQDLIDRCIDFLKNHEIKLRLPQDMANSLTNGEGRTRRLKRILIPLLLLLKLKAVIVVPAVLSLIALVAFKGLGAGLMALIISGAAALKTFIDNQSSKLTYEVLPQIPHWSRAGFDAYPPYDPIF